ncbi:hypothetical protein HW555_009672 [Spodoptera exigua]|uniref:non-specific serine/threonine protein kinase n=1 Tax=Spodoptera exigua TaxID=7107 RepID=A0A835GC03_SPOEX|nr:hypothetical protein HW555_009672 [Spodoptera exigua]
MLPIIGRQTYLGSTRFLKVARARSREGLVVVKVFAVHDPSLPLAEHKERILKIKEQLASAFNCLPYQRVILTDKAGLLMREYCKFSVYDRMSTRPFLTTLEKKWITFQVLYALHRMHKLGICHGDIKLENIMVTSWLWVLLTDIASFKPTFLPDDNPADFSYFFDTSRRRLCYVAPERFVRAPDPHNRPGGDDKMGGLLLSESPCKVGELVPSMDIFSAGCALLELWNDGTPALDLPGLLAYRNGEDRPSTMTLSTDDEELKNLLHSMTERNPRDRKSAELYLDEARGNLEILQLLCENSSSETILDRILPYIIQLSHDNIPRVRARAVWTCARALAAVRGLPQSDCNVFPEYILPELAPRATDPSVPVRIAYANNIARLAETAVRFLDQTQNMVDKEAANINYETELSALHEMVSNDVILSHMVTFLNDKEEAALRGCFFERVVGVAAYVGHHAAPILVPLLQQGLTDQSEWIIAKALRATTNLAEMGLLNKQTLCDLVAESAVFLAHPNLWIRQEVCGLVSCVASLMNPIDVHCKILPLVWPHLKHKLIQVERPELLLESLSEPIPRKVLDAVLRHGDVDRLVQTLRERRNTRLKVKQGTVPQYSEMGQQLRNLFRRLASDGMTEHVENQLLAMSAHLIKIQGSSTQHITEAPGRLVLPASSISRAVQLDSGAADAIPHVDKMFASTQNRRTHKTSGSQESHMNTEWQHMFGHSHEHSRVSESVSQSVGVSTVGVASQAAPPHHSQLAHSASYVQYSMAPCRVELRDLTARMQQKYQKSLRSPEDPVECNDEAVPPAGWRPGNQLLAYLHEHKSKSMYNRNAGPVVSLAACEAGQSLVAATQESVFVLRVDGTSSRMNLSQGRQLEGDGDDALCVAAPGHGSVIAYATLFANIVGWDLRAPGNAWKLQGDLKQGVTTCLYADPTGYLAVGTSSGAICVWDLRFHLPITSVRHPNSERVRRIVGGGRAGAVWVAGDRDAAAWSLESTQRTHALWTCTNSLQPLHYTPVASQYISSIYCGTREGNRFVVTGGSDQRLRYWDLEHPEDSYILLHAHNDTLKNSPGALKYSVESRSFYHTAPITDLSVVEGSKPYLVSASADGVINVWK